MIVLFMVSNVSVQKSILKKKSNAIGYHYVRKLVAEKEQVLAQELSETNFADLMTKIYKSNRNKPFALEN